MADFLFDDLTDGAGGLYFDDLDEGVGGPTITVQPTNASVSAPATAGFSVTATGTGTLTYQWLKSVNGGVTYANVVGGSGGTSASYTTPVTSSGNVPAGDNGALFVCDVTDDNGTTRTAAALLTVSGGALVSDVDTDETITSTQVGVTFTGSGLGANAAARVAKLVQGAVSVTQTQGTGNATGGSFAVSGFATGTGLKYGAAIFRITIGGADADLPVTLVTPADRGAVNVGTPHPDLSQRLTTSPDLASGDQIEWANVVGGSISDVTVYPDGRWLAAQGVQSFQFRVWDVSDATWSDYATQTVVSATQRLLFGSLAANVAIVTGAFRVVRRRSLFGTLRAGVAALTGSFRVTSTGQAGGGGSGGSGTGGGSGAAAGSGAARAISRVAIANLALTKLGVSHIETFKEDSKAARTMAALFDRIRDIELSRHYWNFAKARRALPEAINDEPRGAFRYAYALPVDWLTTIFVGTEQPGISLADVQTYDEGDWSHEGGYILTNYAPPLALFYVRRVTDVTKYHALFVEALACRLAMEAADTLTASLQRWEKCSAEYKVAVTEAKRVNAIQNPPRLQADDSWLVSRW